MAEFEPPRAPAAAVAPFFHQEHGGERPDPYHWLRDRSNPAVRAYIDDENAHTEARTAHLAPLRDALAEEMIARMKEDDLEAPVDHGPWVYVERTEVGKDYPILCRHWPGSKKLEVILDRNQLAEGHAFLHIGGYAPSPDHRYLAFAVDTNGRELYTIFIKDLVTGETVAASRPDADVSLAWASDCRSLFFITRDPINNCPNTLWRHRLGDAPGVAKQILQEDDPRFYLDVTRSRSGAFIVMMAESRTTTEVWVLPADKPGGVFRCLRLREAGTLYFVEHHLSRGGEGRFFILTNDDPAATHPEGAYNLRLMSCPEDSEGPEDWVERRPHAPERHVSQMACFRDHLVLQGREGGLPQIWVLSLPDLTERRIEVKETAYSLWLEENPNYQARALTFGYSSPRQPRTIVSEPLTGGAREVLKVEEVLGGFDPRDYVVERLMVPARDGVEIPVSIAYHKDKATRPGPMLLLGYGAYGVCYDAAFNQRRLSLLDRGVTFAIAHIRGGGELGRAWYFAGRLNQKMNTFHDFVDCAEQLIEAGWTTRERLVIRGGSAGGLLVGATLNDRPELFAGAVADVPFVDVLSTMKDETIPLTAGEWEEWGDPREPEAYAYMRRYSPIDNVETRPYPPLFVYSGLNDNRVQYWEPTKWVATLRQAGGARGEILLYTNTGAGHGGASGRYGRIGEEALTMAFVLERLGLA